MTLWTSSKYKKGIAMDLLIIPIVLVLLGIAHLVITQVVHEAGPKIAFSLNQSVPNLPEAQTLNTMSENYGTMWDRLLVFILFGLGTVAMISAFFVKQHPIFYWSVVVLLIIFALVNMLLSNVYQGFYDNQALAYASSKMVISGFILQWLPFVMLGISIILMVVQYAKPSS